MMLTLADGRPLEVLRPRSLASWLSAEGAKCVSGPVTVYTSRTNFPTWRWRDIAWRGSSYCPTFGEVTIRGFVAAQAGDASRRTWRITPWVEAGDEVQTDLTSPAQFVARVRYVHVRELSQTHGGHARLEGYADAGAYLAAWERAFGEQGLGVSSCVFVWTYALELQTPEDAGAARAA